jgi:hypothetical protein
MKPNTDFKVTERLRIIHFNSSNRLHGGDEHFISSVEEAKALIQTLAAEELKDESIIFNAFDLTYLNENGEWETWYDENGDDINSLVEMNGE